MKLSSVASFYLLFFVGFSDLMISGVSSAFYSSKIMSSNSTFFVISFKFLFFIGSGFLGVGVFSFCSY